MYIDAPDRSESVPIDLPLATAITVCLAGVIGIGVYPGPWVAAAQRIAQTLF
jgi:NADH:ubiquinone oxidoreductase subunit 2 (subunit N)